MTPTNTSEAGLETLICRALTGTDCLQRSQVVSEPPASYGGLGWIAGNATDYDRNYCLDLIQLSNFIESTQPEISSALSLSADTPTRHKFLGRLEGEISKRGVIDVLRHGISHGAHNVTLFYGTPSASNAQAVSLHAQNRFSVSRQLRYSLQTTQRSLDLVLFINGLPIFTFELKNSLTNQTVIDAIEQYKSDRDPREKLFAFGRCVAHFALDDQEVHFCTHLKGRASWFLPFNKGWNDGAGNPPNPHGIKTDYLWKVILTPASLTNILENYAQIVEEKDAQTGKKKYSQIFPRYHQLDVVRKLLQDVQKCGAGKRYLIQHSAGSGKSNSIAWLAHQLIGLQKDNRPLFDSIIVVSDRRVLDDQIKATIKRFTQVSAVIGQAERSGDLRDFLVSGKQIIISTVQKFPFILDDLHELNLSDRHFAIIIDEAHSSQGGRTTAKMNQALGQVQEEEAETFEDQINHLIESKKLLTNASYFAFTATPKAKTLELFGIPQTLNGTANGTVQYHPFHSYTMKQAIQEGFILDVLANYTPIHSYYKLIKKIEDDPEFDTKRANKKLKRFVETHDHAIRLKAELMIDHFHEQVLGKQKIAGKARAMVVTSGIHQAIQYFYAIQSYLIERKSPYRAIVAFSGEHDYNGQRVTEASLNQFSSQMIPDKFCEDEYRLLVCADKFQTGFDQPLLHTMYVDKVLSGIQAVQTLSRLNRSHPAKHDTFVLDFVNDSDTIRTAFQPYYRTTILADETDPNKLHDLKSALDRTQVYSQQQIKELVQLYLSGSARDRLDPLLDVSVSLYCQSLDEDEQVQFKGNAKTFLRLYGFLSQVLPYNNHGWELLSIFLNFLVPRLPAPQSDDLSKGILETISLDSYRLEKQAQQAIELLDSDTPILPIPTTKSGHRPEPELDQLSEIIKSFNEQFGNIDWADSDRIYRLITTEIPAQVARDTAFQNAQKNSDSQNARLEHDQALMRVMITMMKDDTELFKQYMDNQEFRRWVQDKVFDLTRSANQPQTA